MATTRIKISRKQLEGFLKDPRAIKQFEQTFSSVSDLNSEFEIIINEPKQTGNTSPVDLINYIDFSSGARFSQKDKRIAWEKTVSTLIVGMLNGVDQHVGFSLYVKVKNTSGGLISKGEVVGRTGVTSGNLIEVGKYNSDETFEASNILGLMAHNIANGETGFCCIYGMVSEINTAAFASNSRLYANSVAGAITTTRPASPNNQIEIGVCVIQNAASGVIFVRPILKDERSWGMFLKEDNQAAAIINTPTLINLTSQQLKRNISWNIASPTKIVFSKVGLYKVSITAQFDVGGIATDVYLWLRKLGVDIAKSTRTFQVQNEVHQVTIDQFVQIDATTDYIEIVFAVSDLSVFLASFNGIGFCPDAPSVTVDVIQVQ